MSKPGAAKGPLFGTAGLSDSYKQQGNKNMLAVPRFTAAMGLTAFEYQCGRGVRLAAATAEVLAQEGQKEGIRYSLHAPYYISMSSMEEEKRLASIGYILQSARAVRALGGSRVIFHPGACGKQTRQQAMEKAKDTLARMLYALAEEGLAEEVVLCPETMGKMAQLGTLQEVLELCGTNPRVLPCIDFGHLNARTQGGIKTKQDYADILAQMQQTLQDDRARLFHAHFSKIEYTAGGEKCHLTFADTTFGPQFEPLLELCAEQSLCPTFICESAGTQAEDAAAMQRYYAALG